MEPRCFLDCSLRSRAPAVGLVGRRGTGATAARWINAIRRSSASWRLRSCVRWRCALITSTPSRVNRRPASRSSRVRPCAGRLGEGSTSKRSCTAVASLLTFCPPGPEARMNRSSSFRSSMLILSSIRIMHDEREPVLDNRQALRLVEDHHLGDERIDIAPAHETARPCKRVEVLSQVACVIRLMEITREAFEHTVVLGLIPSLQRVHDDQAAAALEHARELAKDHPTHLGWQLMKHENAGNSVLPRGGEGD